MAGEIFIGLMVLWAVLALATAYAATQVGYSFSEFFAYSIIALPVALVVVVFASEFEARSPGTESTDTHAADTTACDLPNKAGIYALRTVFAGSIAVVIAFVAMTPQRSVVLVEGAIVAMQAVAHQGVKFDECVSEETFAACQPFDELAVLTEGDLDVALRQGIRMTIAEVRPVVSAFVEGVSLSSENVGGRSVVSERTAQSRALDGLVVSTAMMSAETASGQSAKSPVLQYRGKMGALATRARIKQEAP